LMSLSEVSTQELVDELARREGVEVIALNDEEMYEIEIYDANETSEATESRGELGPARILIVTD
jgi:hypothetical protein